MTIPATHRAVYFHLWTASYRVFLEIWIKSKCSRIELNRACRQNHIDIRVKPVSGAMVIAICIRDNKQATTTFGCIPSGWMLDCRRCDRARPTAAAVALSWMAARIEGNIIILVYKYLQYVPKIICTVFQTLDPPMVLKKKRKSSQYMSLYIVAGMSAWTLMWAFQYYFVWLLIYVEGGSALLCLWMIFPQIIFEETYTHFYQNRCTGWQE